MKTLLLSEAYTDFIQRHRLTKFAVFCIFIFRQKYHKLTRKHSSRQRTLRFGGHHQMSVPMGEGCVEPQVNKSLNRSPMTTTRYQQQGVGYPRGRVGYPRGDVTYPMIYVILLTYSTLRPLPLPEQNDRHLLKHYLRSTTVAGGNKIIRHFVTLSSTLY